MAMSARKSKTPSATALPDADVTITDLAGDGDHYAAMVIRPPSRARPACSSTRWFTTRCRAAWAAQLHALSLQTAAKD